jgi:hypothetical protein
MSQGGDMQDRDGSADSKQKPTSEEMDLAALRVAVECLASNYETDNREKNRSSRNNETWSRATAIAAIAYTGLTFIIMIINSCQYSLTKKQLIGANGAVVVIEPYPTEGGVHIRFITSPGHVPAANFHAHISIERFSWPDMKTIGSAQEHDVDIALLDDGHRAGEEPAYTLDQGWWPSKWADFMETKSSVRITTEYSYDNGFGDTVRQKDCVAWYPPWTVKTPSGNIGGGEIVRCDNYAATVRRVILIQENAAKGIYP